MERDDSAEAESWDEIHGFVSPGEYRRFLAWVNEALESKALVELPVEDRYGQSQVFEERWFEAPSGARWRLVAPDPPFQGVFLRLSAAT